MKRVHLLAVDGPAVTYEPLVAAARELGLRIGWLDLPPVRAEPPPVAGPAGAFRRVAVTDGLVVSAKPLAGPPVLRDLVREHFLGCVAVLVAGAPSAPSDPLPRLRRDADLWHLDDAAYQDAATLARALRSPVLLRSG
jgi:hypothetical protein